MAIANGTESTVDVLIVGAGPAGLMAALWMARLGIKARIVDKRGSKVFSGQADGLSVRSQEIFDSFGFQERVEKEAGHIFEMAMWNPGLDGKLARSDRMINGLPPGFSRYHMTTLNQGRIEQCFLDNIKDCSDIRVERNVMPQSMEIDESLVDDDEAYPIKVKLLHFNELDAMPGQMMNGNANEKRENGLYRSNLVSDDTEEMLDNASNSSSTTEETVRARYIIGCEGAHSWTRRQLGFGMEGESRDTVWGVIDLVPITNFPDIRALCTIHSANAGGLLSIPREGKLVRMYIHLKDIKLGIDGRLDKSQVTPQVLLETAQKILSPYKFTCNYVDWWTAYQTGQRVSNHYESHSRVFLAGDAVHTHSPKAGQGMNVSMQDTYNLGWKLGLVLRGLAKRSILRTYEPERRPVAQELIDFDTRWSGLFSGRPMKDALDEAGISMEEFGNVFSRGLIYISNIGVEYPSSQLIGSAEKTVANGTKALSQQSLATKIPIGQRFPSVQVLNQADARPWQFQQKLKSDGRFRIIVFAGNMASEKQKERIASFCASLEHDYSFLRRKTRSGESIEDAIEILTLHSSKRKDVELRDFPQLLYPFDEENGWDYEKVFADDESYLQGHGHAYDFYGVDPERGCVVVVRPDQHVGMIVEFEDSQNLNAYFNGVFAYQ